MADARSIPLAFTPSAIELNRSRGPGVGRRRRRRERSKCASTARASAPDERALLSDFDDGASSHSPDLAAVEGSEGRARSHFRWADLESASSTVELGEETEAPRTEPGWQRRCSSTAAKLAEVERPPPRSAN